VYVGWAHDFVEKQHLEHPPGTIGFTLRTYWRSRGAIIAFLGDVGVNARKRNPRTFCGKPD
jgi:hypothetical protein